MKTCLFPLGLFFLGFSLPRAFASEGAEEPIQRVAALAARAKISMGTIIEGPERLFRQVFITKAYAPSDCLSVLTEIKGKRLIRNYAPGEVLREEDVGYALPDGFRMIGVRVKREHDIKALLLHLDRGGYVDVFWTVNRRGKVESKLLFHQVLAFVPNCVLYVDPAEMSGRIIDLALRPKDIPALAVARELGRIDLIPRPRPGIKSSSKSCDDQAR